MKSWLVSTFLNPESSFLNPIYRHEQDLHLVCGVPGPGPVLLLVYSCFSSYIYSKNLSTYPDSPTIGMRYGYLSGYPVMLRGLTHPMRVYCFYTIARQQKDRKYYTIQSQPHPRRFGWSNFYIKAYLENLDLTSCQWPFKSFTTFWSSALSTFFSALYRFDTLSTTA